MNVLHDLHGTLAIAVICGLLFVDEAGLPLPIAPNEVLLLLAGVLVSSGAVAAWVLVPVAALALAAGMIAGYGWARTLGDAGLRRLAEHVRATEQYDRACKRLSGASPAAIALARLVPGVRPYATLASGAAEVELRRFLLGAIPALLLWEGAWIALGFVLGLPAEHYLGQVEKPAFQGGALLLVGVVAYLGLRRATREVDLPVRRVPPWERRALALGIDAGMIGSIAAGLVLIARVLFGLTGNLWLDPLLVAGAALCYLVIRPATPRVTANGIFIRPDEHKGAEADR